MEIVILSLYFHNHGNMAAVKDLWSGLQPISHFFMPRRTHASESEDGGAALLALLMLQGYLSIQELRRCK
jgi:hypothetical protein